MTKGISYVDFFVTGDPISAKTAVSDALVQHQFQLTWQDEWSGTAEQGSKVANYLLGGGLGLAKYLRVGVRIMRAADGETIVHIQSESSGHYTGSTSWMKQAIGDEQMTDQLAALQGDLVSVFTNARVLRNVAQG